MTKSYKKMMGTGQKKPKPKEKKPGPMQKKKPTGKAIPGKFDMKKRKDKQVGLKQELASRARKRKRKVSKMKKFPDYSGDGKVTKKDILMGRGVITKKRGK